MALFISLNAASLLFLIGSTCIALRHKTLSKVILAIAFVLVVFKAVLHYEPAWEASLFPWVGYIYLQEYWLYPVAMLFFGLAVGHLPVLWNRVVVALVALAILSWGARQNLWIAFPETHGAEIRADTQGNIAQSTKYTCGPCACVSALSYLGVSATEREMARLCLTHKTGTTVFNEYRGLVLKLQGTPYTVRIMKLSAKQLMTPGLTATVSIARGFHSVCVHGAGDHAIVHDPYVGQSLKWFEKKLREKYFPPAVVIVKRDTLEPVVQQDLSREKQ